MIVVRDVGDPTNTEMGEAYLVGYPKNYVHGSRIGLVFCHAFQEPYDSWMYNALYFGTKYQSLFYALLNAGYPLIVPSIAYGANVTDAWGNDAGLAQVDKARQLLQNTFGAKSGPVLMMGSSMGGLTILNYTLAYPGNVKTSVLICPVTDLNQLHNSGTFAASINAAYGGTYVDDTYGDTHSPIRYCSDIRNVPMQLWVADDDTVADPVTAALTISALRNAETHHMLGGHNNITDFSIPIAINWLAAHE